MTDHPQRFLRLDGGRPLGLLIAVLMVQLCCLKASADSELSDEVLVHADFEGGSIQTPTFPRDRGWQGGWKTSQVSPAVIQGPEQLSDGKASGRLLISGTGARNNPARRHFSEPLTQAEFFVTFRLYYENGEAKSSDDPEFFVLWLDRVDGGDHATHSANVPNIGFHVADRGPKKGKNVFMARIGSGNTAWSKVELSTGRWIQVVARLSKPSDKPAAEYSRLELWVDPSPEDSQAPDVRVEKGQSITQIQWMGFSTGLKTEPNDTIQIDDLLVTSTWNALFHGVQSPATASPSTASMNSWKHQVSFSKEIYPLLKTHCFDCHAGAQPDSGYRLDVKRELLGYSTGEVLAEPGKGAESHLVHLVSTKKLSERMPPEGETPLTGEQIELLKAWIDQGMEWDESLLPTPRTQSDHWAFQPIQRPEVPESPNPDWVSTQIDAFIDQAQREAGVTHSPVAEKRVLVRRLYLDLIGLPPTPEQVQEFLDNQSTSAYSMLVEELLRSPHYGERWGRYWLDLSRWAESQGYQHDFVRPYAWRYRDYVINSFNADKPYDRFLKEQLAGDELQPYSDENLVATGFLASARISGNQEDDEIQRNDVMVDIVNATGSALLGLTLECAQCHNHKFDPISQRDYYQLQAFFVNGQLGNLSLREPKTENPTDLRSWIPAASYAYYTKEVAALRRRKLFEPTTVPHTWGYLSAETGDSGIERLPVVNRRPIPWEPERLEKMQAHILIRGDANLPGPPVTRCWPEVLSPFPDEGTKLTRSALADWMADKNNPLVARVWVNRIWQYHFGRGIVSTPSDFGVEGARPMHPELLDWLASELMRSGWSTKHIHRLIVMSSTYRQQSLYNTENSKIDSGNALLWRWPRRRLEAEAIRDSVLVASGELERTVGGISVPPERQEQDLRRTIYLFQQRSKMPTVMEMFDAPEGIASCSRRSTSTVALQPLFLLNSQFMANRSDAMAKLVQGEAGGDPEQQVRVAFFRTLCREPDQQELSMALEILKSDEMESISVSEGTPSRELVQLCHALLNLNEFLYIP